MPAGHASGPYDRSRGRAGDQDRNVIIVMAVPRSEMPACTRASIMGKTANPENEGAARGNGSALDIIAG